MNLKPRKIIRIGYVGHTQGSEGSGVLTRGDDEINKDVKTVLKLIKETLPNILEDEQHGNLFAEGEWRIEVNGSMATCTEITVAETLVSAGFKVELIDANISDHKDENCKRRQDSLKTNKNTSHIMLEFEGNVSAQEALILARSDILLAVWDGKPGSSTARAIKNACDRGVPVIWIHASENREPALYDGEKEKILDDSTFTSSIKSSILPDLHNDKENKGLRMCLEGMAGDPISNWFWERLYLLTSGKWRELFFPDRSQGQVFDDKTSPIDRSREILEAIAVNMANRYRTSVFGLYLLSAFAVFWAAIGQIWAEEFDHLAQKYAGGLPIASLSEIAMIVIIIVWYWWGNNRRVWHDRWVKTRYAAEMVRMHICFLEPVLGVASFMLPGRRARENWAIWLYRRLVMAEPLQTCIISSETICNIVPAMAEYLREQVNYHNMKVLSLKRRHKFLHYTGLSLFGLTFAAAVVHLFLHDHAGPVVSVLILSTIFFPALGSAFHAIMVHEEIQKIKRTSDAMSRRLAEIAKELEELAKKKDSGILLREIIGAAELMADEAGGWYELVKEKTLELPA